MQEFNDYPLMMQHPAYQKAKSIKLQPQLSDAKSDWQGTPERFPPVIVNNLDQEQVHLAQGYHRVGKSNAADFAALVNTPADPLYVAEEYPKWVDSGQVNEHGQPIRVLVNDGVEETALLAAQGNGGEEDEEDEAYSPGEESLMKRGRGRPRKVAPELT